jgi:hypothetical protein
MNLRTLPPTLATAFVLCSASALDHPYLKKPQLFGVMEFDMPRAATAAGELRLRWSGEPDVGGGGTGPMMAEVFLIRK